MAAKCGNVIAREAAIRNQTIRNQEKEEEEEEEEDDDDDEGVELM